jgi:hypothetical protein
MRSILKPSVLLHLPISAVACATVHVPREYRQVATLAPDAAYGCALTLVDSLGYTLRSSDRASGFLSAHP